MLGYILHVAKRKQATYVCQEIDREYNTTR